MKCGFKADEYWRNLGNQQNRGDKNGYKYNILQYNFQTWRDICEKSVGPHLTTNTQVYIF